MPVLEQRKCLNPEQPSSRKTRERTNKAKASRKGESTDIKKEIRPPENKTKARKKE